MSTGWRHPVLFFIFGGNRVAPDVPSGGVGDTRRYMSGVTKSVILTDKRCRNNHSGGSVRVGVALATL